MNIAQLGVKYDQIRVEEVDGELTTLVSAEGVNTMMSNAGTPEARDVKALVDAMTAEYQSAMPYLSANTCRERAIIDVLTAKRK